MMNKSIAVAVIASALVLQGRPSWSQETAGFKLKHRSSFTLQDTDRNPFWPVGWVKPTGAVSTTDVTETVQVAEIRPEDFELTAILLGVPPLAVINGREYAEGDFIRVKGSGQKTKVQVAQVADGRVVLRYMNKNYTVLLHRIGEDKKATPTPTPME